MSGSDVRETVNMELDTTSRLCVGVFGYARPRHLERCLESLSRCPEAKDVALHIYCDGPPTGADDAMLIGIAETRAIATKASGFGTIRLFFSEENQGVARAVPAGVTAMLQHNEQVVVIEDDLEVSPCFLTYMLDGLRVYASDRQVMAISGYTWPTFEDGTSGTYFSKFAHYWGWATWRRAWQTYTSDGLALLTALEQKGLSTDFDGYSVFPRKSTQILELYSNGEMGIWDICWSATVLLNGGQCLYPRHTLVRNHGFDGSGMHCRRFAAVPFELQELSSVPIGVKLEPAVEEVKSFEKCHAMRQLLLQR